MRKTVVHFEIGCSDLPATVDFYRDVFGWSIQQEGNAGIVDTGKEGALPGHINKLGPGDPDNYVTVYIETDSLEDDLTQIESKGGKTFCRSHQTPRRQVVCLV